MQTIQCHAEQSAIVGLMEQLEAISPTVMRTEESQLLQLLALVGKRDRLAFETLYDQTVNRVFSLALRMAQDRSLAEEVVSDVYLYVWQNPERHDSERGSVMAWITILCRSRCLDALRRNSTRYRNEQDSARQSESRSQMYSQDLLLASEDDSRLHACLAQLQEDDRQLMALAYFRGYSHAQIAAFVDMPLGTIKTRIRRGLALLKMLMEDE